MKVALSVHPKGLGPRQAAKAWFLRVKKKAPWSKVRSQTRTVAGKRPGIRALELAVRRMQDKPDAEFVRTKYANCGRKKGLSAEDAQRAVDFVKQWRTKYFCTSKYICQELGLTVSARTLRRALNQAGFFWRPTPKKSKLTPEQLQKRKVWVDKYIRKDASWWRANLGLDLDGVTLTKAPRALNQREKHAAQAVKHMWVEKGETLDNNLHTYNRYGVQLGIKVPLWGGFTGDGRFTLKHWSEKPKLDQELWANLIGKKVKDAAAGPNIWHDNEGYLKQPEEYAKHGLVMNLFPPSSGDLNPVENVWSDLRQDLAVREFEDLKANRTLTVAQFRARASQILHSYSVPKPGQTKSHLQKLVDGMPSRLARCKANNYGNCGK